MYVIKQTFAVFQVLLVISMAIAVYALPYSGAVFLQYTIHRCEDSLSNKRNKVSMFCDQYHQPKISI